MRSLLRWSIALAIIVGSTGCEKEVELPQKPQLVVNREVVDFGLDFGRNTFIGTEPQDSFYIENGGLEDLKISAVTLSGDPVFRMEGPTETELKGLKRTYVRVFFKPTAEKTYAGKITIESNAENAATKEVTLSGKGVKAPVDAGN